ncbi:MAG: hypothetical protein BWY54_00003 [Candidatus Dependentiae bacterium ADurb.Bin331]|nr:MAG: hypothetical protein BWY54_00003 [Candidatus Dependentiae bacterium ADurb.Bin331]
MKIFQKITLMSMFFSLLCQNTFCTEFKLATVNPAAMIDGIIVGALAGYAVFKSLEKLDKWYISSKKIEGAFSKTDAHLPKRVDLDFKSLYPNFDKQDDQILKDQHASLLHKLINNGKTCKFLNIATDSIIPQIQYNEPTLTKRKSYNGIKAGFVLSSAIIGAYVVGNVVQK